MKVTPLRMESMIIGILVPHMFPDSESEQVYGDITKLQKVIDAAHEIMNAIKNHYP